MIKDTQMPVGTHNIPGPIAQQGRIESLDVLRGTAVLGILLMNIQSYSMPDPAYFNPTVFGDLTGVNFVVWLGSHLLADTKFMTIFSLLFGAGIVLFCQRLEEKDAPTARIYYRRILWLLLFGLLHAYLLWHGDILVWYSLSALIAYVFWRMRPGWLLFWSLLLLTVGSGIYALAQWSVPYWPAEAMDGHVRYWNPSAEVIAQRLAAYQGGWVEQMGERVPSSLMMHTFIFIIYGLWRTLGVMLLGMALMKWGLLSGQRSRRFYCIVLGAGLVVGLAMIGYGAEQHFAHEWSVEYSLYGGTLYNYCGSLVVGIAYVAAIMLLLGTGWFAKLQGWLAAVGRMAFTNYILQTVICTILFYGHGFGLFGRVPRWGQLVITIAIWIVLVVLSNAWLARFRFGPLEWLWRSLTYRRRQPMNLNP